MTQLSLNSPVGNWVTAHPRTSRVFESLKIDYCCGGGQPLEEACRQRQIDPVQVVERLRQAIDNGGEQPESNWTNTALTELCDHIEATHHAYLRHELPRLTEKIEKVVDAHGKTHLELPQLQQAFADLRAELEPHMFKEERILFPAIRQLEQADAQPSFAFGSVSYPIQMMEHEHDNAGGGLSQIRALTRDYEVPDGACNTYRTMMAGLEELESDLHQHIHKENNILFPRAIKLEASLASA